MRLQSCAACAARTFGSPPRSDDPDLQSADARDAAFHLVTGLHGADALGRPGVDQIARPELVELREMLDRLVDIPDQLRDVASLALRTVDVQPDLGGSDF